MLHFIQLHTILILILSTRIFGEPVARAADIIDRNTLPKNISTPIPIVKGLASPVDCAADELLFIFNLYSQLKAANKLSDSNLLKDAAWKFNSNKDARLRQLTGEPYSTELFKQITLATHKDTTLSQEIALQWVQPEHLRSTEKLSDTLFSKSSSKGLQVGFDTNSTLYQDTTTYKGAIEAIILQEEIASVMYTFRSKQVALGWLLNMHSLATNILMVRYTLLKQKIDHFNMPNSNAKQEFNRHGVYFYDSSYSISVPDIANLENIVNIVNRKTLSQDFSVQMLENAIVLADLVNYLDFLITSF